MKLHMQANLHTEINILHVLSSICCILYVGYFNLKHSSLKGSGKVGKNEKRIRKLETTIRKDKGIMAVWNYMRESHF